MNLYVKNADLYEAYLEYRSRPDVQEFLRRKEEHKAKRTEARDAGESYESDFEISQAPTLPEIVAIAIYKIATNYSRKKNWGHLHFIEEMISDAIVYAMKYAHGFDPEKSRNPYAYITQIVHNSFLQRIASEKHQNDIKREMIQRASAGQVRSAVSNGHFVTTSVEHSMMAIDDQQTLDRETRSTPPPKRKAGRPKKRKGPNLEDQGFV